MSNTQLTNNVFSIFLNILSIAMLPPATRFVDYFNYICLLCLPNYFNVLLIYDLLFRHLYVLPAFLSCYR